MKFFTEEYIFDHPWHTVVTAAWRKYPNPLNGNVTGIDVLSHKVENSILKSERILQSQFDIPTWTSKLIGFSGTQYSHEYTEIDVDNRQMSLLTRNLSASRFVKIDEKLTYQPHSTEPNKTVLKQEVSVSVNLPAFADTCEKAFLRVYSKNAKVGKKGLEWVVMNLLQDNNNYQNV
uniref:PRELI/MSF1 domain-containing protein n=1 Tax=Strongyloides papillosus TaxID=174720 RepID=A0A0N5CFU8_STREA